VEQQTSLESAASGDADDAVVCGLWRHSATRSNPG